MGKKSRYILLVIIIIVSVLGIVGYSMWDKPARMVEDVESVSVSATDLANAFAANEAAANEQYLNKAIQVEGKVSGTEKNQDGGMMVMLETGDPIMAVQCAMRERGVQVENGQEITISGFCSGSDMLGVRLTGCVIK